MFISPTPTFILLIISAISLDHIPFQCDACVEEYSTFVEHHPYTFVDKSQALVEFFNLTTEPYNLLTCPRYFGKTMILSMIKTFAQIEYDETGKPRFWMHTRAFRIFSKLVVASYPQVIATHLAQHPVISVNLHFDTIEFKLDKRYTTRIMTQLRHAFKDHQRICDETPEQGANITQDDIDFMKKGLDGNLTKDEIQNSLYRLSEILYYYFNHTKVILLVDGYDTAAILAINTTGRDARNHYEFIHEMLARALEKGSRYVQHALVAATSSVSYYSVDHSKVTALRHRAFLDDHPFKSFCGVFDWEATNIFNMHYCDDDERLKVKMYYNGYSTPSGTNIYEPYSLTRYFESKFRTTNIYRPIDVTAKIVYDFLHFNDVYEALSLALLGDHSFESNFVISKKYDNDALYAFLQLKNSNYTTVYLDKGKCVRQMLTFIFERGYLSHIPQAGYGYRSANQQTRVEILNIFQNFTKNEGSPVDFIV